MKKALLSTLLIPLLVALSLISAGTAHASTTDAVLFVHGVVPSDACPLGKDVSQLDAPLRQVLTAEGWTGSVLGIAYHCGDRGGPSIQNAGASHCNQWPTQNYSAETPIERLGCDLAWWIHANYSSSTVHIVGNSMGGLITRYALTQIAAGNPAFPTTLSVGHVVTMTTPYGGADKMTPTKWTTAGAGCGSYYECKEMLPGSTFLTALANAPSPLTDWTTEGGGPDDNVDSFASSSAVTLVTKYNYYAKSPVNYNHSSYLTDTALSQDEPCQIYRRDGTLYSGNCYHSLAALYYALAN